MKIQNPGGAARRWYAQVIALAVLVMILGVAAAHPSSSSAAGPSTVHVIVQITGGDSTDGNGWQINQYNSADCSGPIASARVTHAVGTNGEVTFPVLPNTVYSFQISQHPAQDNFVVLVPVPDNVVDPVAGCFAASVSVPPAGSVDFIVPVVKSEERTNLPPWGEASLAAGIGWGSAWFAAPPYGWIIGGGVVILADVLASQTATTSGARVIVGYPAGCTGQAVFEAPDLNGSPPVGIEVVTPIAIPEGPAGGVCSVNPFGQEVTFTTIIGFHDGSGNPLDGVAIASQTVTITSPDPVGGAVVLPVSDGSSWFAATTLSAGVAAGLTALAVAAWIGRKRLVG